MDVLGGKESNLLPDGQRDGVFPEKVYDTCNLIISHVGALIIVSSQMLDCYDLLFFMDTFVRTWDSLWILSLCEL